MTDAASPARSLRPSRRNLALSAAALVLVGGAVWGLHWWSFERFMVDTDNAYARADVVTVAPLVTGRVVELAVADNQRVTAGQVLAQIDDRDYRARREAAAGAVAAAEADIAAQQARIANLGAQISQQDSVIAHSVAAATASAADAHRSELEFQRQRLLTRQAVASAQALEGAEADARRTQSQLAAANASAAAERKRLPVLATQQQAAQADLDKARAALRQAHAALDLAVLQLARTVIRAPVSGTIGQRTLRVGEYVVPGTPVMAVVPDAVYVVANYKETQVDRVRPGQPARIAVDAFGGVTLTGHVDSIAPASGAEFALLPPDNATGNFTKIVQRMPVRIRLDPGQRRARGLHPGMSVVTQIDTRESGR
ncbi:membrane fusion protein (multidrug efflux system) [Novosphingobium sp. PhB165]|nr:membrane fusion protein (multidrug efflux system) [Novosphingobium sp. PhB165]